MVAMKMINIMKKKNIKPTTLLAILTLAFLAIMPLWSESYALTSYRDVLLLALFALSLDIFWGRTGILSFGHATFFGLGAYGMAIVSVHFDVDPAWVSTYGLLFAIGLSALVALLVGYFMLYGGVRGAYFTIVTLALTLIAQHIAVGWSDVTGGDSGLIGVKPLSFFGYTFSDPYASYYLVLILLAICISLSLWLLGGRLGLILQGIQDSEMKMRTLGYRTQFILLMTFVVSASLAALAGAVYATGNGFVAPDMIALLLSTEVIIWVTVGGTGTLIGPIIGTAIVWQLQQEVSSISISAWPIVIGTFFILLVLVFPQGLPAYLIEKARSLRKEKRAEK